MAQQPFKIIESSEKQLPCNIEAEQAVIASILVSNDIYDEISPILDSKKFFDPIHVKLYETIENLISKGLLANPITLKNYFENNEGLKELGGQEYLIKITKFSCSKKQAIDYANIIQEMHVRRELIKISETVLDQVSGDEEKTSVIEVNCETDFVAKNEDFINFVKEISEINNSVNSDLEKLNKSKMKNNKTLEENLVSMIAKIGEKITLGRSKTLSHDNSKNYSYLHTVVKDNLSKLAVMTSISTSDKSEKIDLFGKQLCMHIAASNPISINIDDIEKEILDKEQELVTEELKNSGKPEDIAKKISSGKMNKFKEENSLMTQQWVMEPKKKVKDIIKELNSKDLKIVEFFRIKIGD